MRKLIVLICVYTILVPVTVVLLSAIGLDVFQTDDPQQSGKIVALTLAVVVGAAVAIYQVTRHGSRTKYCCKFFLSFLLIAQAAATYQNGLASIILSGHLILVLLLLTVPQRWSLASGAFYLLYLYIFQHEFTLGLYDHQIEVRFFASAAALLLPLHTLFHSNLPPAELKRKALLQLLLSAAVIAPIADLALFEEQAFFIFVNALVFAAGATWVASHKTLSTLDKAASFSVLGTLVIYSAVATNGMVLFVLPMFILMIYLLATPMLAGLFTVCSISILLMSVDILNGVVFRGIMASFLVASVLTVTMRALGSDPQDSVVSKLNLGNIARGLTITLFLCFIVSMPFISGHARFDHLEDYNRAIALMFVFALLAFLLTLEFLHLISKKSVELAQVAESQAMLLEEFDRVASSGRIGTARYVFETQQWEPGGAFRDIYEFPIEQYPELRIEDELSRYTPESREKVERAFISGIEGTILPPMLLELEVPEAGQRFVELRGSLQVVNGRKTLNAIIIDQTQIVLEQRQRKRLERAQRMALAMTKSIVIDLNTESGMATLLEGDVPTSTDGRKRGVPFSLEEALAHQLDESDLPKMRAFLKARREQIMLKVTNPGSDKAPFWARFSIGTDFMQDGQKHVLLTRQNIETEVALRETATNQARQLSLALDTGKIAAFEVDIVTNNATLVAGYHPVLNPNDQFNFIDFKYPQLTREVDVDRLHHLIRGGLKQAEFRFIDADKKAEHWVRLLAGKEYVSNNRIKRLITRIDITALKAAAEEQRRAQERQRELFAVIGHELRTPVAAIDMILGDAKLNPTEKVDQISAVTEALLNVLEDMRHVVAPERALTADTTDAAPSDIVKRAVGILRPMATQKEINLDVQVDAELDQRFNLAAQSLRQVTTNLVKNAIVHAHAKNIWVKLSIVPGSDDEPRARLSVEDDGRGISDEDQLYLFEAFRRGQTDADGTGLGLFIVAELSKRLSGEIHYQPGKAKGACFVLEFPLTPIVEQVKVSSTELAPEMFLKGKRVLLAEDDRMLRMLSEKLMFKAGAKLTTAVDGEEALAHFDAGEFDIVITDIMMPRMDGYGLASGLRKRGFTGPIIGVTAAVIGSETDRLKEAGADAVLSKPIKLDRVVKAIEEISPFIPLT